LRYWRSNRYPFADLIVLGRSLFKVDVAALHNVRVLLTLLGREPVYCDPCSASR